MVEGIGMKILVLIMIQIHRYTDDTILMAENKEELKRLLLMKVKEEGEKVDLKLNSQKTKNMASGPSLHGK